MKFKRGQRVTDRWYPEIAGTVESVSGRSVFVRLRFPEDAPFNFQVRDGVVRYDHPHANAFLSVN